MIRQTVSTTMALLATTPQAVDLLQSIEPKASGPSINSAGEIVYPTATWAFTKTGNLNLVNTMLDGTDGENANNDGDTTPDVTPTTPDVTPVTPDVAPITPEVAPVTPDVAPTPPPIADRPDAAETDFWDFQKLAQAKTIDEVWKRNNDGPILDSITGEECGAQYYEWDGKWQKGKHQIAKNECTDRLAVISVYWKVKHWEEGIAYYYQTFNDDGSKVLQDSVKTKPDNCVDDAPTVGGNLYRTCQFLVGQLDDWEARGLAQADQSIFGFQSKPEGQLENKVIADHLVDEPEVRVNFCGGNNLATCTDAMAAGLKPTPQ